MAVDADYDITEALSRWRVDTAVVRERMCQAPTPRELERWHGFPLGLTPK